MSTAQKVAVGVIAIGVVTAATLPGRQTVPVINATTNLATGVLHTDITGAS